MSQCFDKAQDTSPDLLALQARVRQLEEALHWYSDPGNWDDSGDPVYPQSRDLWIGSKDPGYELAHKVLSTPAPDVSPLWGILALELQFWDDKNTSKVEATSRRLKESVYALTPELRALIAEMSGRGE